MSELEQDLRVKLNSETARISWPELERHFARGVVLAVTPGLDLIEVAHAMACDDSGMLAAWMQAGQVTRADEAQARDWHVRQPAFWAVVVAPWVVIQEVQPRLDS